jgi:hypothetical protein
MDLNKEWREDQARTPKDTSLLLRRDQSLCEKCLDWDGLVTEVWSLAASLGEGEITQFV